ncbi:MAG TPA: P-II family nitrogen regulator [Nitrospiria bacterium]|nr:P-II family nitrogen regulator [Nitrospiria bacterium]
MREIIAIIHPDQAAAAQRFLQESGIHTYAMLRVLWQSEEDGLPFQQCRLGKPEDIRLPSERMFWIAVEDDRLSFVVNELVKINRTGRIGHGKLVVVPIEKAAPVQGDRMGKLLSGRRSSPGRSEARR